MDKTDKEIFGEILLATGPHWNKALLFYIWVCRITLLACEELKWYHLNKDDFKNLKWEDEPVEVSVNMED